MDYDKEYPDLKSKYVYLPKMGESATFTIKTIKKVNNEGDRAKFNFVVKKTVELPGGQKATTEENLGYNIQCELADDKILSINNLAAFKAVFIAHNVQEGDTIKINHKDKGVWEVVKEIQI